MIFGEGLARRHVGPGDQTAVDEQKWLDAKAELIDLEHAGRVEQGFLVVNRHADHGPRLLLAEEVAREPAAGRVARDLRVQAVR